MTDFHHPDVELFSPLWYPQVDDQKATARNDPQATIHKYVS